MLPYNVNFFRNNNAQLEFVYRDVASHIVIDDDYISGTSNTIDVGSTEEVKNGDYISIRNDEIDFFGVVTDVSPGEYSTQITYRPFVSIFDEDFLFDTQRQGAHSTYTLEQTIVDYLTQLYVSNSDTYQRLPIQVSTDLPTSSQTTRWSLNLTPDTQGSHYTIIGLYSVLIVNALKKYGVAIRVRPSFTQKKIILTVTKINTVLSIDGDLDNVNVKTLKYNERPTGVNKLVVYNTENYSQSVTFYVYSDRTFGVDDDSSRRIKPVVRELKSAAPDSESTDPTTAFAVAALDVAYSVLSGITWDNLIELEVFVSDENIHPMEMEIGQKVRLVYKGGRYESILTGKTIGIDCITLLFGSERIQYSKRFNKVWRKQNA